ncbi:MAG: SpoIIE family protein phosphatase [Bacteroidales bacterium]|nr:SpoIIE family protein phosphatase [Bacteroidales bacterium]
MDSSKLDFFDSKLDDEMVYDLKGTWEFYWDTLLNPSQIQTTNLEPELVNIPNTWAEYNHSQNGKATYHIQLNVPPDNFYAFKFKRIFLSYKVWINDSVSLEVGKVSANIDDFVPNDLAKEFVFYADTNILNITIQVSNYNFRKAGITNVIKFGTPEAIEKLSYSSLLYEVFIIGALAFMMLFYFILFFYNKKVISNLYFSLFLLFEVITLGFDGELFFVRAFPGIGWVLASKIWNIASYLRPLFLLLFIEGLTRNKFSKFLKKSSIYFVVIMTLFIAFAPVKVYTHTIIIFIAFALGTLLYEIVITAVSIKDNKNIIFAFLGLVFILVSTLNDSLYDFGYINSFYSVGLGVFVYALLQAFLLSIKNAELFEKAENLTNSVEIQNRLKEALLSTPSYDISQSLYAFVETVGIEKIIIFSIEKDTIFISNIVEKDKSPVKINLVVDLSKDSSDFFIPVVKNAFEKQESAFFSNKNKIYIDEHKNNQFLKNNQIKTIVVIPVLENNKTIATIYLENRERALNNAQQSVLKSASAQFYSIINTAVAYFRLQEMNQYLEKEVKDRTLEVEKQKFEIDLKNQELDEKIQLLEEQYIIQQEINDELETQNLELEKQNIRLGVQNSEISKQKEELEKHNKQISDNIKYASTILSALKQEEENIPFRDFFVIDFPRDIVSGDFFWSKKIENKFIFALADSTGHGVPGALMSLLGIRLINKAVNKTFASNSDFTPANILNILRETIIKQLTDENQAIKDGFDMSFCIYNSDTKELSVSGAYNPIFIIRNNEIIHIKGDRMPIGSYIEGYEKPFSNNSLTLRENDIIYLFTDGYVDQFGGENYTKYYMANFKKLLIDIQKFPFKEQSDILIDTFKSWKRNNSQIDDVSIVSFLV